MLKNKPAHATVDESATNCKLPLSGVTVIALEHAIAAPFCTRQLAENGARVIKIERPGTGDFARAYDTRVNGQSSHFVWTNRSKESITLDLKHPNAAEIMSRLISRADVLVQNLAPGSSAKLGLDWQTLAVSHPQLIVCDISGYGDDPEQPGPMRDKKAYDLLIQSESGFVSVTGSADLPVKAGCSIADIAAGMYAYCNVLTALLERGQSGKGQRIDVSMLESMVEWMGYPMYYAFEGAAAPQRAGAAHATIYPYGPFPTGDGKTVMLGLQNEREWGAFCEIVLMNPSLKDDSRFSSNPKRNASRLLLDALIVATFSTLSASEILFRLEAAGIANANLNDMAEVWDHPQLKARQRWVKIDTPAGKIPALLPPGVSHQARTRMGGVPALGADTDAVLLELGYTLKQIADLRQDGVL